MSDIKLRGCLMMAEDGVMFNVAKPDAEAPPIHSIVNVERKLSEYRWEPLGFTMVQRLMPADAETTRQVWNKDPLIKTLDDLRCENVINRIALNKDKFGKDKSNLADW